MGTGLEWAAVAAMVAGAGATAYSVSEQQKAAKRQASDLKSAQEKERSIDMAVTSEQVARDRRSQIREARIKRAMVANTASTVGQGAGSAVTVGGQAVTQQAGLNIGNINTAASYSNLQGIAAQNTANVQNSASYSPGVSSQLAGSVGGSLMQIGMGQASKSIFKE